MIDRLPTVGAVHVDIRGALLSQRSNVRPDSSCGATETLVGHRVGRLARHDVYLREDAGVWLVEDRVAVAKAGSQYYQHRDEDSALEPVQAGR